MFTFLVNQELKMCFPYFQLFTSKWKQVILTSDKAPVDMQDIEQRLLSFQMGLSAEVHQPDYDTRISILKIYCIEMVSKFRRNYRICRSQY
jgi:chromosomal replication initiation ATPase DnaA